MGGITDVWDHLPYDECVDYVFRPNSMDVACGLAFDCGRRLEEQSQSMRRMLDSHAQLAATMATLRARGMTEGRFQIGMEDLL